jgi:hypothetical protein
MLQYHETALRREKVLQQGWEQLRHHIPTSLKEGMQLAVSNGNEQLLGQINDLVAETATTVVCLRPVPMQICRVYRYHCGVSDNRPRRALGGTDGW